MVLTGFAGSDAMLALEALRCGAQDFVAKSEITRVDWWRVVAFARERKRHERQAVYFADRDPRTGLPLAHMLRREFTQAVARAGRDGTAIGLVAFALRGYGQLREELGEDIARRAVAVLATRLRRIVRGSDCLAARPPDGFLLLLEKVRSLADVERAAHRLTAACEGDVVIEGEVVRCRLVAGHAFWDPGKPKPFATLELVAERDLYARLGNAGAGRPLDSEGEPVSFLGATPCLQPEVAQGER